VVDDGRAPEKDRFYAGTGPDVADPVAAATIFARSVVAAAGRARQAGA
jgi:hypothetical protein